MNKALSYFVSLSATVVLLVSTPLLALDSTWIGASSGIWTNAGNWSAGIPQTASDTATINTSATITVPTSITLKTLTFNATGTVTVATGATLAFLNGGGDVLTANANAVIDGDGSLTFSMTGTAVDYANIKPATGTTLTLAARIAANGNAGIELNSAGTILLTNPNNAFVGAVRISTANGTIAFSNPGALGLSAVRFDGNPSYFRYTGSGPATLALPVQLTADNGTLENAGTGALALSGLIAPASAGTKTLTFAGAARTNIVTGSLANGAGVLNVISGTGTLLLNGAATNQSITVNAEGTLAVGQNAFFQNVTLSCFSSSVLSFNPAAASSFTALLPLTNTLNGLDVRFVLPAAATSSTVTIPGLLLAANASLDVVAPEIGTARNKLLIQNFVATNRLPSWFRVNGLPAAYSDTLGVIPVSIITNSLTALGPSVIPSDPTSVAVIDSPGTVGGITLAADPTTVFSLTQNHADNPAAVNLGGKTFASSAIAITTAGNSLSLTNGTLTSQTSLSALTGPFNLPSLPTNPIAWFDLSDASTVTTNADGRITQLNNKGSLGATLNATVPSGSIGPLYVPGAVAGRSVARSDGFEPPQGLRTTGNAGITGNVARTAFIVTMRSTISQNALYALYMGADAAYNQTFAIVERATETSFVTMGNDLNAYPTSPVGHNVLTFTTGLGGTPNAGQGFRNGISLGTQTFNLATVDNPISLLHRGVPSRTFSGPGEVAEALVFNYTLSDTDRAAVEAYLMQKWQIVAARESTQLALRNDSITGNLTADATVGDPYGATLSLSKTGAGTVTLAGPIAYSGLTLIYDGALTFATPNALTNLLVGPVAGQGALVKSGPGGLALASANTYVGGTTISSGTLLPSLNGSLGNGTVNIMTGGALDIRNVISASFANSIRVEGSGPDGLGALRNSRQNYGQQNALKYVTLAGDTAVQAISRLDVRSGAFDFGGHSLTVNGGSEFAIVQSAISNVTASTSVHVANGMMRFENCDFLGSAANVASADSGAGVTLYQMTVPMQWSLQLAHNAYFLAGNGGTATNINRWAGPVTLSSGTSRLNAVSGGSGTITGSIGGNGGLLKEGPGWFWLLNAANNYAGATTVTQGTLYAVSASSLGSQGGAAVTVTNTGTLLVRAAASGSPDGWSASQIEGIAKPSIFTTPGTTTLGIDTIYADFSYSGSLPYAGLSKLGPRKLTLTGAAPDWGPLTIQDGELDLTGTGSHNLHTNSLIVGALSTASTVSVLRVAGATLTTDDPGFSRAGPTLTIGSVASSRSVLHVGADAIANGRLTVGDAANSAGAVYQTGGSVTNTAGTANEAALGLSGFGYYRLDSGTFAHKGSTQFGRLSGSTGIYEQRGGNLLINPGTPPANGVIGDYYNGTFTTRSGVGVFMLSGGTFTLNAHTLQLGEYVAANENDGYGTFTIENGAADMSQIILANRNGTPQAYVNLNGGTLTTPYFQKGGNNSTGSNAVAAISFNGGILSVPSSGNNLSSLVRTGANNSPALLNVFAGGARIETLASANILLDQPLRAPVGLGVTSLNITAAGTGYIAPPAVLISGGNGTGATAFAEINLGTGALTAIRVTSPGVGYTSAPTVTLRGGGYTSAATASATLGSFASGGLTKLGIGILNLAATNTYTGPTVVSNGTLRLSAGTKTLTVITPITVAGGTLDLAGNTLTNINPVVIESGRLFNGTVSALSFSKIGSGTATLSATSATASQEALYLNYVQSLAPIAWYDPSDTATVTLNGAGRVIALANKGTRGSALDAATNASPNLSNPPLLATGAVSYAASRRPMLKIDANNTGLVSAGNLGISGASPRTVVVVLTRESDTTGAFTCFGAAGSGQMWEVCDRADGSFVVIGGYGTGYDLSMSPRPTAKVAHVLFTQLTTSNISEAWRTGNGQNYNSLTAPGSFNTSDSRFFIGNRVDASKTVARGEIGEILIFDRLLSSTERAQLMSMLQQKWATVGGFPQPEGQSIAVDAGTLRLSPSASTIAALAPAVWYDPSDSVTVTTNSTGRITRLNNKGVKTTMDAVTGINNGSTTLLAPQLVTGALSYAASRLPMIGIDINNCGLGSESNLGITGTAPRTVVGVFARDNTITAGPVTSFGSPNAAQLFEVGDRHNGTVIGCYGNDMVVTPLNPVQQANVLFASNTGDRDLVFQRTGVLPNNATYTIANTLATVNSRFFIGQRPGTKDKTDFRGQIGETLVFDRLLTDAERADIESYLVNKWMRSGGADGLFSGMTFNVATGATLDLSGTRTGIILTGSGTVTNGTLGSGIVISPAGDSAIGTLALNGVTLAAGSVYRLTASGGSSSDRLLVNGDLSAMTVVPATAAEIPSGIYIIATGTITHKPVLSGFPGKFKLILQGNNLLLTTVGGSIIRFY